MNFSIVERQIWYRYGEIEENKNNITSPAGRDVKYGEDKGRYLLPGAWSRTTSDRQAEGFAIGF